MENDELKELLQNDVPEVDYDSKAILQRCKQENNKFRIHKQKLSYVLSSIIIVIALAFGIVFTNYRLNKDIIVINNDIENLGKMNSNEAKMLEIIRIERAVNKISDAKWKGINLRKLSFEAEKTVTCIKKDASWRDYFDESDDYYKFDSLINFDDVKRIDLTEGMFSSIKMMSHDNSFINSILSHFNGIPYVILYYDETEDFFERFFEEMKTDTKDWRNYDIINLYKNQIDIADNAAVINDFICTFHISPSGYTILYVPVFDNDTGEILECKEYISLVPINYSEYENIKNDFIKIDNY